MKPVFRLLAGLVAVVVVVVIALAAYFAFLFDPNDYRDRLVEAVETQTGRRLTLDGPLEMTLFPWLGFSVGAAELGNAPGFSERPFASLASAQAQVKLWPLLSGRIEMGRVTLSGLQLSLERDARGRTNWADLGGAGDDAPSGEAPETDSDAGAPGGPVQLTVGGIELTDAAIRWADAQAGADYTFNDVSLTTGAIEPDAPFDFQGGLDFSVAEPAANGRLNVSGRAALAPARQVYRVDELRVEIKADGAGVPGGHLEAGLLAHLVADLGAGTIEVTGVNLRAYEMIASGQWSISGLDKSPRYEGSLQIDGLNPRTVLKAMGKSAPATANAERLKRASLSATLSGEGQRLVLDPISGSLDDSELSGRVEVVDLAKPEVRFDLSVDALDVDSYLPPAEVVAAGQPNAEVGAETRAQAATPLDLRGPTLDGRLRVADLSAGGVQLEALDTRIKLAAGRLTISPKAALYGGRLDADIGLVAQGKPESLSARGEMAGIGIGPLLRDLTAKPERLSGTATVRFDVSGTGLSDATLRHTAAGTVRLEAANGAIKGVNVAQFLREAQARLEGGEVEPEQGVQQTDFSDLSATVVLGGGLARNDDLSLRSPLLRVAGEGQANLVDETIDYLIKASVVGTLTGQGGKTMDQVRGVTVPIRVGGSFAAPTYRLDTEALLKEAVSGKLEEQKAVVEEKVKAAREKAKEEIKDELRKGLEGLFKK